jgi:Sulfotransferase family
MSRRATPAVLPGSAEARLAETLQEAVDLLREAEYPTLGTQLEPVERGTLLQQCLALCEAQQQRPPETVRTVHHLACTGGTLICKCLAAMPNVQLLSEVDPLSTVQSSLAGKPRFVPSDMGSQLRQSSRGTRPELLIQLFRSEMRLIHADASDMGQRLVLRDHSHGHFCHGPTVPDRPTLIELIPPEFPVAGIVTVRDPVASFSSLSQNKWLHFTPSTIDEYGRRYLEFLDRHAGLPIFRYEDFVARPAAVMQDMCDALALPFNEGFEDLFDVFKLSGDSGRSGRRIAPRGPRTDESTHRAAARESGYMRSLCERLGYAIDDVAASPA